jgi:thiol-disulfide isomerase/thioredoxin
MHAQRIFVASVFLFALFILGCGTQKSAPVAAPAKPGVAPSQPEPKPAAEIELRTVDIDGYSAEIAKHKGKVVLVDFWATWCGPCTAQFPHTVEIHEKYANQGLDVLSLSFDEEGDASKALDFLKEQKAEFPNLRSEYGAGTESMDKFDLKASVPHYRLYDKKGVLREKWDGKPEGLEARIEELLKEEA